MLNARYYDSARTQFLSQDPIFLSSSQNLSDPQSLNSYSYSEGNPIVRSDPGGRYSIFDYPTPQATQYWNQLDESAMILGQDPGWKFALNHPYTTGALVALGTYPALVTAGEGIAAYTMATWAGVGTTFAAQQGFASSVYAALTLSTTLSVPGFASNLEQFDPHRPSTEFSAAWAVTTGPAAAAVGGYPGAFADAYQFAGILNSTLGSAATNLFSSSVQTRTSTANNFNSAIGSGSGGGSPSNSSLWVTPSGAVVNWGGLLVSAPPSKK